MNINHLSVLSTVFLLSVGGCFDSPPTPPVPTITTSVTKAPATKQRISIRACALALESMGIYADSMVSEPGESQGEDVEEGSARLHELCNQSSDRLGLVKSFMNDRNLARMLNGTQWDLDSCLGENQPEDLDVEEDPEDSSDFER